MIFENQPVGYVVSRSTVNHTLNRTSSNWEIAGRLTAVLREHCCAISQECTISVYLDYKKNVANLPDSNDLPALIFYADSAAALTAIGLHHSDKARSAYEGIINHDHVSEELKLRARMGLILLDVRRNCDDDSEAIIMLALDKSPTDPRLWNVLASVYMYKSNWVSAHDAHLTALSLAGIYIGLKDFIKHDMAIALLKQGKFDDALAELQSVYRENSDIELYADTYKIAQILTNKNNVDIQFGSTEKMSYLYSKAGLFAIEFKNITLARQLYEMAIKYEPDSLGAAGKNLAKLHKLCAN